MPSATSIFLTEAVPELAAYIAAGLVEQDRADLLAALGAARIHRVEASSSHVSLDLLDGLDVGAMINGPGRERIGIGSPRGVRRRRWIITLEVIDGRLVALAVSYPGILRTTFRDLARVVNE